MKLSPILVDIYISSPSFLTTLCHLSFLVRFPWMYLLQSELWLRFHLILRRSVSGGNKLILHPNRIANEINGKRKKRPADMSTTPQPMFFLRCSSSLQQLPLAAPGAQVVLKCPGVPSPPTVSLSYALELTLDVSDATMFSPGNDGSCAVAVNGKRVSLFPHCLRPADVLEISPCASPTVMYLVIANCAGSTATADIAAAPTLAAAASTRASSLSSQVRESSALFAPMQKLMRDVCLKLASLAKTLGEKKLIDQRPLPSTDLPEQLELTYSAEWCFDTLDRLERTSNSRKKMNSVGCQVPLDADRHLVGAEFALAARNDAALSLLRTENLKLREMLNAVRREGGNSEKGLMSVSDILLEVDALRSQLDRKNASIQALVADVWHKDRQINQLQYGLPQDVQQALKTLDFERRRYTELIRQHKMHPAPPFKTEPTRSEAWASHPVTGAGEGRNILLDQELWKLQNAAASESAHITRAAAVPSSPLLVSLPTSDEERAVDDFVTMQLALRDALLSENRPRTLC